MSERGLKGSKWSDWRPIEGMYYHTVATFEDRRAAWQFFTECEFPGLRIFVTEAWGTEAYTVAYFLPERYDALMNGRA